MKIPLANYAFIDSQNVNLAIQELGWKLDWQYFYIYLREKYEVEIAYLFIGFLEENQDLYRSLQQAGFILIFKEVLEGKNGIIKGNVDAELILQAMLDYNRYNQAVIITGDGDFACLVRYLYKQGKLKRLIVPSLSKSSVLLRKTARKKLVSMNNLCKKLEYKKYKKKRTS